MRTSTFNARRVSTFNNNNFGHLLYHIIQSAPHLALNRTQHRGNGQKSSEL